MASRLQERLDFALVYTVEGQENMGAVSERLSELEQRGTNVNEITKRSREIMAEKAAGEREVAAATQQVTQQQFDMATAVSQSNEIVRDATIGAQLLKFEYEEGQISQQEYAAGLDELRGRLEGVEVNTMSSIRAMRSLANEQRNVSQETDQSTGSVRQNVFAMNRLSRTITAMPRGINAVATQIPFLAGSFGRLSTQGNQSVGVFMNLIKFLASPVGLTIAIGALIPLVIRLTQKFDLLGKKTIDTDEAGKDYAETIREITDEVLTLQGLTDRGMLNPRALEDELQVHMAVNEEIQNRIELIQEQMESTENITGLNIEEAKVLERNRVRRQQINTLEQAIENNKERQLEIETEIFTINELRESQVFDMLVSERGRQRAAEAMQEIEQEMVDEQLAQRERAEERVTEAIERQMQRMEQRRAQEQAFRALIDSPPDTQETGNENEEIQRAMTRQRLAEEARLSVIRDSVSQEHFIRLEMERQFQQERNDLIRQGITDQEDLDNLRIRQDQDLQDRLLELEDEQLDRKTQLWEQFAASIQGFGSVIHGESEENAKKAFELDKALAIASATVFGAQAVIRALAGPGGIPEAIATAATVAAQIAKIIATKFRSRGDRGRGRRDKITHQFRGADTDTVLGVAQPERFNFPDTLKLRDSAGRFLTNLEYERDKSGDEPYLIEPGGERSQ